MAVIQASYIEQVIFGLVSEGFNSSIDIEFYASSTSPVDSATIEFNHNLTPNYPVSTNPSSKDAIELSCWFDQYYNQIHVNPTKISLGNLLGPQEIGIEIWNAYGSDKTFINAESFGDVSGLSISGLNPVTTFTKYQVRYATFNAQLIGSPIINAVYRFDFGDDKPTITVTGQRIVVLPFKPTQDFSERLEWLTDVIKTKKKETRLALRESPRQYLSYQFILSSPEYSKFKAIAHGWSNKVFAIPIWTDAVPINIEAGSTVINFNTSNKDFRSNDFVLFIGSKFEAAETLTVNSTSIELLKPVEFQHIGLVVPLRFAKSVSEFKTSRGSDQLIKANCEFVIITDNQISDTVFELFKGVPVFTDAVYNNDPVVNTIITDRDIFDNGSGQIDIVSTMSVVNATRSMNLIAFNGAQLWKYRRFLHYLKGRQKAFFIRSGNNDLELVENIDVGSTTITVKSVSYEIYYSVKYIEIEFFNGLKIYRKITGGVSDVNSDRDTLTLDSNFTEPINRNSVKSIQFLDLVRLNTDTVDITYESGDIARISFNVIEVPDVV